MNAKKVLGVIPRQTQPHPEEGHLFFRWLFFESAFKVSDQTLRQLRQFRALWMMLFATVVGLIWSSFPERCAPLNPWWWCNWREILLWSMPMLAGLFYHHGTRRILIQQERTHARLSLFGRIAGTGFTGIGQWSALIALVAGVGFWLSLLDLWLFEQPLLEYYGLAASAYIGTIAVIGLGLEDTLTG
jgi:hypothetical protein